MIYSRCTYSWPVGIKLTRCSQLLTLLGLGLSESSANEQRRHLCLFHHSHCSSYARELSTPLVFLKVYSETVPISDNLSTVNQNWSAHSKNKFYLLELCSLGTHRAFILYCAPRLNQSCKTKSLLRSNWTY